MVGMHVRLQCVDQRQLQLLQQSRIAARLLIDRIDQHGLARPSVGEQVGVGRGVRIEQLAKDQHRPSLPRL